MSASTTPIRAVLFDLYGTLVDNMPFHIDAWTDVARALGRKLPRDRNRAFVLDGLDLRRRVDAVVGAEEVAHGKPEPDLFLEAARRLGHEPAHTLVFEDAVLGIRAARAANMRACGVTTAESAKALQEAGAMATLPHFEAVPDEVQAQLAGRE